MDRVDFEKLDKDVVKAFQERRRVLTHLNSTSSLQIVFILFSSEQFQLFVESQSFANFATSEDRIFAQTDCLSMNLNFTVKTVQHLHEMFDRAEFLLSCYTDKFSQTGTAEGFRLESLLQVFYVITFSLTPSKQDVC